MTDYLKLIGIGYLIVINVIGFFIMGIDKQKAKHNKWRIRERTLFLVAILFGGIGTTLGMYAFRHKTKHWYFVVGMPAIVIAELILIIFVIGKVTGRF